MKNIILIIVSIFITISFTSCTSKEEKSFKSIIEKRACDPSSIKILKFEFVKDNSNQIMEIKSILDSITYYCDETNNNYKHCIETATSTYDLERLDILSSIISSNFSEQLSHQVTSIIVNKIVETKSFNMYKYSYESRDENGNTTIKTGDCYFDDKSVYHGSLKVENYIIQTDLFRHMYKFSEEVKESNDKS